MQKEYFGFIEPFYNQGAEYYPNAQKLNAARYAISEEIRNNDYQRIFLPKYMCESLIAELQKHNLELYEIDNNFMPVNIPSLGKRDLLIYPNYFGVFDEKCNEVVFHYRQTNVLLDNTQAFYYCNLNASANCYSPRKFFEVTDGAYLLSKKKNIQTYDKDSSAERYISLLKRCELGANKSYQEHLQAESELTKSGPKEMSKLTELVLKSIDYHQIKSARKQNFFILHNLLGRVNELRLPPISTFQCAMVYPLLIQNSSLRETLIESKIYVPTWWKSVQQTSMPNSFEHYLSKNLIPLPIDQRYNEHDMETIAKALFDELEK